MKGEATAGLSPLGGAVVTTFGLGHLRPAPGTWGSIPPVALAAAMILAGYGPADGPAAQWVFNAVIALVLVVFCIGCVVYGEAAEARFGKKDPGSVCADETAGVCIPLLLLPASAADTLVHGAVTCCVVFFGFRVFDILKLPPANGLQRVRGGWGILLDDLVAGVQTMIVVQVFVRLAW
ncbi:MAG: phosphatidylglycerophosphatase A [Phycisphaeraceae bacterium]|nr:phosphatidylglycerophosphatase A [Phycisphaeraceae bacterium]